MDRKELWGLIESFATARWSQRALMTTEADENVWQAKLRIDQALDDLYDALENGDDDGPA